MMILEHDRAQTVGLRDPGSVERIDRSLGDVRVRVHMDVDRPCERSSHLVPAALAKGARDLQVALIVAAARSHRLPTLVRPRLTRAGMADLEREDAHQQCGEREEATSTT